MKKAKRGFTLIEVALFLVITGALFVGVTVGVQNSIYQQRYTDTVQNFVEFLRGVYSGVYNVQNTEGGKSEQAIYGKMITFGEEYNLAGEKNTEEGQKPIYVYNVIGEINEKNTSGNAIKILKELKANIVINTESGPRLVGVAESYMPRWSAEIQKPRGEEGNSNSPFTGTILIVRHPVSGIVYTYYSGGTIQANNIIRTAGTQDINPLSGIGAEDDAEFKFSEMQIDFCVNPYPEENNALRRDVRLVQGATNSSGIEIMPDNDGVCNKE